MLAVLLLTHGRCMIKAHMGTKARTCTREAFNTKSGIVVRGGGRYVDCHDAEAVVSGCGVIRSGSMRQGSGLQ